MNGASWDIFLTRPAPKKFLSWSLNYCKLFSIIFLAFRDGKIIRSDGYPIRIWNFEFTEPDFFGLDMDLIFKPENFWIWIWILGIPIRNPKYDPNPKPEYIYIYIYIYIEFYILYYIIRIYYFIYSILYTIHILFYNF